MAKERVIGISACIVLVVLATFIVGFAVDLLRRRQRRQRRQPRSPRTLPASASEICLSSSTFENVPIVVHAHNRPSKAEPGALPRKTTRADPPLDGSNYGRRVRFNVDAEEEKQERAAVSDSRSMRRSKTIDWISWILNPTHDPPTTCCPDPELFICSVEKDCDNTVDFSKPTGILKNSVPDDLMVEI